MKASSVTIGGRPVKKITLGGDLLWEKEGGRPKAYYFNGEDADARISPITIADEGDSIELYLKVTPYGDAIQTTLTGPNNCALGASWANPYLYNGAGVSFMTSDRFTSRIRAALRDGKIIINIDCQSGTKEYVIIYDGVPFTFNAIARKKAAGWWHGYIYGIALNGGEMMDLSELDGWEPHNVVAYDVDENGEIIISSGKVLNS